MRIVRLAVAPNRWMSLVLEPDVRAVHLKELPHAIPVLFAVDAQSMPGDCAVFRLGVRLVLGRRAHVRFFESFGPRQMCGVTAALAKLCIGLLEQSDLIACMSGEGSAELLAAAVLLERGRCQPDAIAEVREVLPDAFPDIDSEIAVAVVDELRNSL